MTIDTNQYLTLGINAARAGQKREAQQYFKAVLKQSPQHVPALFWLAYVAPTPAASMELFERVLKLDPDNERAQAGIRWAQKQIELAAAETAAEAEADPAATAPDETAPTRDQFLSAPTIQEQSQKGVRAHRARRTINPFLAVLVLFGAATLIMLSVYSLLTRPPETLAAWLPGPTAIIPKPAQSVAAEILPDDNPPAAALSERQRATDTLPVALAALPRPGIEAVAVSPVVAEAIALPMTPVELIGPAGRVYNGRKLFEPVEASLLARTPVSAEEKWIEVDLSEQVLTAWEGNVPVMSFLTSTGLPDTPTVQGEFHIYWKLESTLMSGPGYYLPDVPYTMYFHNGYGLHGAYWHNNFGQPMSHGCVNLSNENSKSLFEWADPIIPPGQTQVEASADNPGTLVLVHE